MDRPAIVGGLAMQVDGKIGLRLPDDPDGDHMKTLILADGRGAAAASATASIMIPSASES